MRSLWVAVFVFVSATAFADTVVPRDGTDKLTAAERQSQDEKTRIAVQTPPISSGDNSTRGLALLSLQLELP